MESLAKPTSSTSKSGTTSSRTLSTRISARNKSKTTDNTNSTTNNLSKKTSKKKTSGTKTATQKSPGHGEKGKSSSTVTKTQESLHSDTSSSEEDSSNNKRRKKVGKKLVKKVKRSHPPSPTTSDTDSDSDHDSSETSGIRGNIIDIDSILESDGESDTEPNDLGDLGLLTELINDELDEKMKKKILSREYVDFNKLYYGTKDNDVQMVHVKRSKANSVTSVTKKPQKQINNILSWSRAFQLYASIYTSKYTEEAAGMFQCMTLIQTLAKKTPNWQLYDIKFCKLRRYRTLPWSRLHVQTHLYASLATPSKPTFQNNATPFRANSNNFRPSGQNQNQGRIFKKGYCWEFQRTGKCSKNNCSRTHKCSLCDGSHAGTFCPRAPKTSNASPSPARQESTIRTTITTQK